MSRVAFATPAAVDAVDPSPAVACDPAARVGVRTRVDTGHLHRHRLLRQQRQRDVQRDRDPRPARVRATWQRPLGEGVPALVGQAGRTIPLKLEVRGEGGIVGPADIAAPDLRVERLAIVRAGRRASLGTLVDGQLRWADGVWQSNLDTTGLGTGCLRVTASADGTELASAVVAARRRPGRREAATVTGLRT